MQQHRCQKDEANTARANGQGADLEGRGPAGGQGSARLKVQRLAGLTGIHCACLHVPGADLGATPPTCAVIVHIPAHRCVSLAQQTYVCVGRYVLVYVHERYVLMYVHSV